MLDTTAWSTVSLAVLDELHLDTKNVRLETDNIQVEADILADMFSNEDALGLVEGIVKVGYLTHEIPIVVKRRGKYVVVEGNRRLAALKAIQNPQLVPEFQARITSLTKRLGKRRTALARIEVKVAPSQAQADQLIAALHTGNLRRPWTPARQAAFFQAQIDAGRTFQQLLDRYPTIDVPKFVFRARLLAKFKASVSKEPELDDFLRGKTWKYGLSTLARIYEAKDFIELTGLQLDAKGELKQRISATEFKAVARIIVEGMKDSSINTRSLNTVKSPRFTRLMTDLRGVVGTAQASSAATSSAGGAGATGANAGGASTKKAAAPAPGQKKPPPKTKVHYLDVSQMVPPAAYPVAVTLHMEELSTIDIQKFPNATFLMLRAILEKTIKSYAEAKSKDIAKSKHSTNGRVQLHNCLGWLIDYLNANGPKKLVQPAKAVKDGTLVNFTATKDALNAINHNHEFRVDADDVLNLWHSIDPLMRGLMKP